MTAVTLTAGDPGGGAAFGYAVAAAFPFPFGSISAEPIPGVVLGELWTSGGTTVLSFLGDQTALGAITLTVNGVAWTVGAASYDGSTKTSYTVAGAGFTGTGSYTVAMTAANPPAVFDGPTWIGATAAAGSTAATSVTFSGSGRAAGDKLYVAVATANQAIAAPSGFTEVPTVSPQSRGTAAAAGGIRLALFERVSDGTETTVSIADSGNHQYAVGFVVRPATGQTIAIEASAGKKAAASTSHSGNAITTTAGDCLILDVWATDRDSAGPSYSAQANANLTNLTERFDAGTTQGQGSGIVIYTGEKQSAGSVAATAATSAASAAWCAITLALKNVSTAAAPLYRGPAGWSTFYRGVKSDAQIYKGAGSLHA